MRKPRNFANQKIKFTPLGGLAVKLTNKTGANTIKGTLVEPHDTLASSVKVAEADCYDYIGVILDSGDPDGSECWVVVTGIVEVLLKDSTEAIAHAWVKTSDAAGRVDATAAAPSGGFPAATNAHFREVGHNLSGAVGAGTDVLIKVLIHTM